MAPTARIGHGSFAYLAASIFGGSSRIVRTLPGIALPSHGAVVTEPYRSVDFAIPSPLILGHDLNLVQNEAAMPFHAGRIPFWAAWDCSPKEQLQKPSVRWSAALLV